MFSCILQELPKMRYGDQKLFSIAYAIISFVWDLDYFSFKYNTVFGTVPSAFYFKYEALLQQNTSFY